MLTRPIEAPAIEPLSRWTSAATPTVAQSWARRFAFRYAQPVEAASGDARLDEHLVGPERGLEHAREELRGRDHPLSTGAVGDELGTESEHHRWHVRRRVAVRERAAERAAVTHLRVADLARRVRDDRAVLGEQAVGGDGGVTGERADRDVRAAVADVVEVGHATYIDEFRRARDAQPSAGSASGRLRAASASPLRRRAARPRGRRCRRRRSRTVPGSRLRLLDRAPDTLGRPASGCLSRRGGTRRRARR